MTVSKGVKIAIGIQIIGVLLIAIPAIYFCIMKLIGVQIKNYIYILLICIGIGSGIFLIGWSIWLFFLCREKRQEFQD